MKRTSKILLTLLCAFALMAGTAVATGVITIRTLQAQYMDIRLTVDGAVVTPKDANGNVVEPFMVDGTVYLPVRAVGEALGRGVEWDADTHTVALISPYLQDARQLVELIESSHPCFVLNDVPEGYAAAKESFLTAAAQPGVDQVRFAWAAMAYTSSLKDGHTQMWGMVGGMPQVQVQWAASGEHLYLLDKDGKRTDREVTKLGGVPVGDVFAVVDTYFAFENQAFADQNHSVATGLQSVLYMAGVETDGTKVALTVKENGKETTMSAEIAAPDYSGYVAPPVISHEKKGDVFYIDFNSCVVGPEVDATAAALKKAVESGTKKVIIDVRGNGGGNSMTCVQLLNAMGMEPPAYGAYVRISPLAKATYPDMLAEYNEDVSEPRNLAAAKANPDVELVVLTDAGTFSSATMLGVFVQDGKLGTLIGQPSANSPSCYGDVLSFKLENTGFQGGVSFQQFQRPDEKADQKTLVPDVQTKLGEDALQIALDFLKTK